MAEAGRAEAEVVARVAARAAARAEVVRAEAARAEVVRAVSSVVARVAAAMAAAMAVVRLVPVVGTVGKVGPEEAQSEAAGWVKEVVRVDGVVAGMGVMMAAGWAAAGLAAVRAAGTANEAPQECKSWLQGRS